MITVLFILFCFVFVLLLDF